MSERCTAPPEGWVCSRQPGHEGPCAALPDLRKGKTYPPLTMALRIEPTPEAVKAAVDAFELADRPTDDDPNSDFRAAVRAAFAVDEAAIRKDEREKVAKHLHWYYSQNAGCDCADLIERLDEELKP